MWEQPSLTAIIFITTISLIFVINVAKLHRELEGTQSLLTLSLSVVLIFLFVTIPSLIAIPVFWTYKQIIKCYLKIKYRSQFIGMIEGSDVTYAYHDKNDSLVMVLFMYEVSADKTAADVFESVRNLINKHYIGNKDKLKKFHCVLRKCSGYVYMKRENVMINDCVIQMKTIDDKEEITKEELMELINEYKDGRFFKNDRLLWDFVVGTQSVRWQSKNGVKFYPTLFRFHHAISDGFSFAQFLFGVTADKSNDKNFSRDAYISKIKDLPLSLTIKRNLMISLYSVIYSPTMLTIEKVIKRKEPNILHGPMLNKVNVFSSKVDDGEYFKKIKYIKSCVRDVTFSDILFSALSFSLYEYFKKHSQIQPKYLQLGVPFLRKAMYLPQLPVGGLSVDDINLQNIFDLLNLKLPIYIEYNDDHLPLQQRLKAIQKETRRMAESTTNTVLHFATHLLLQILPLWMLRYVINMMDLAAVVSILPSPSKATMGNGVLQLQNIVCWIPRMKGIGCNFSVLTYGNKLQLGLNVDSALIPKEEDAQSILDGIFKYLTLLEEEIDLKK
ncbi:hypothetical protein RN001_009756 [Aquatica leii]|uniref:O-acyltransferase WSD1 C-terminal domain-containing protein n=1 Tax=Aquatica leii TaxID=1421715 RepID=A0AAN7Q2P9_9COLE|nr:hypothetical protein RN001_009756 [Aquatica leii]